MFEFPSHFEDYGKGNFIRALPQRHVITFSDFSGGYNSSTSREAVTENFSPYALDIEVTKNNKLIRAPGTTLIEAFASPRNPATMILQGSLDFTAELVFFDAPFIGAKRTDATEWADVSLHTGPYAWTNFGGTLVFSDGRYVYARQANEGTTITKLDEAPVARVYASWAGRVWAGMSIIDGNFEPVGLSWSAANSDYRDWTGLGSGFELLFSDIAAGDRIIALKPMGLDFMAILLRNSIWIARRTGQRDRPADPQLRVPSSGAVNAATCQVSRFGVIYLSDSGVYIFDGNNSEHISKQIDDDLLPLDYANINSYTATYNPLNKRYYLHTPAGITWIYEIENQRWFRRSLNVYDSIVWPVQVPWTTWGELIGDWSNQAQYSWYDYAGASEGEANLILLGDESGANRAIAKEDPSSLTYFNITRAPEWHSKTTADQKINNLLSLKLINVEYTGSGPIEFWAPTNEGEYALLVSDVLYDFGRSTVTSIPVIKTGRLDGLKIVMGVTGNLELSHIQLVSQIRGPRVELVNTTRVYDVPSVIVPIISVPNFVNNQGGTKGLDFISVDTNPPDLLAGDNLVNVIQKTGTALTARTVWPRITIMSADGLNLWVLGGDGYCYIQHWDMTNPAAPVKSYETWLPGITLQFWLDLEGTTDQTIMSAFYSDVTKRLYIGASTISGGSWSYPDGGILLIYDVSDRTATPTLLCFDTPTPNQTYGGNKIQGAELTSDDRQWFVGNNKVWPNSDFSTYGWSFLECYDVNVDGSAITKRGEIRLFIPAGGASYQSYLRKGGIFLRRLKNNVILAAGGLTHYIDAIDVSDPDNPILLDEIQLPYAGAAPCGITTNANSTRAYVGVAAISGVFQAPCGVAIIDISDPTAMSIVNMMTPNVGAGASVKGESVHYVNHLTNPYLIQVAGNRVYTWDVDTDELNPTIISSVPVTGNYSIAAPGGPLTLRYV